MKEPLTPMGFRLAREDIALLDAARERHGLQSRTEALRYVLRTWARAEGVELPKPKRGKR